MIYDGELRFRPYKMLTDILTENEQMSDDRDLPLADRTTKPAELWVTWIPVGKGQTKDEGAVVGTEWVCRKRAAAWLREADVVEEVYLAPINPASVVTASAERKEPVVAFSDDLEF